MSNKAKPIWYKDCWAMPGSELYQFLRDGDAKKAEQSWKETHEKYVKLHGLDKASHEQNNVRS